MAKGRERKKTAADTAATVGFEAQLWQAADALRGSMDAAEYKHVVIGLIFLKYISDAFEEEHARLRADRRHGADREDRDEYLAMGAPRGVMGPSQGSGEAGDRPSGRRRHGGYRVVTCR